MNRNALKLVLGLVAGAALVLTGMLIEGPRFLDAQEQSLIRGAANDKCCNEDVRTCDQRNFGLPCNTQPTGAICLNCWGGEGGEEGPMEHLCNNSAGDDCDQDQLRDCGGKRLGKCAGFVCSEEIQVLGEDCLDVESCGPDGMDPTDDVCDF